MKRYGSQKKYQNEETKLRLFSEKTPRILLVEMHP